MRKTKYYINIMSFAVIIAMFLSMTAFAQVPQIKTNELLNNPTWIIENPNAYELMMLEYETTLPLDLPEALGNPPLNEPCPLKIVLVLDESGSIGFYGGTQSVRNGVNTFVSNLAGTGTQMAIIEFSNLASRVSLNSSTSLQTIDGSFQSAVSSYLLSGYNPGGSTNWADAFSKVKEINDEGTIADLVIFFTDGQPNVPSGSALSSAVTASDIVKAQGTRIFMLGVSSGVSISNLQAVSGTQQVNPPTVPFAQADYGLESDFTTITNSLADLSTAFLTDYYADNDLDGYGAGPPTNACDAPGVNYVTNDLDCDDTDGNVYPGAPEICDGKDNDCSGNLDDADCDGVEDLCDVCPGGDDSIDADGDGLPDCANEPTIYDPSWECDNKGKKITVCHVDEYGNRFELCVSKNAAAGHLGHGDFLGPCISCDVAKTSVSTNSIEELHLEAYPIPTNNLLTVKINAALNTSSDIQLVDYLGRIVYQTDFKLHTGVNYLEIDLSEFTPGLYMLNVDAKNATESIKIIVK